MEKGFCNFKVLDGGAVVSDFKWNEADSIGSKEARDHQIIVFKNHRTP